MKEKKCIYRKESLGLKPSRCNKSVSSDNSDRCILHSHNEDKDLNEFTLRVNDRIEADEEEIDLIGCYFPKSLDTEFFKGRTFKKYVNFSDAIFAKKKIDFSKAKFSKGASFYRVKFSEQVLFSKTSFEGGMTTFREAEFNDVSFNGTLFRGEEVSFSDTKFIGVTVFDAPHFYGQVYFLRTQFKKCCKFLWIEIRTTRPPIFKDADLSKCSFLHSNIDKVDFRYCPFCTESRKPLYIFPSRKQNVLKDELDYDDEVEKNSKDNNVREKYEDVRRLYLELKRNFEERKDWNTAGDFHYGEMECRRKMKGWFSLEGLYFLVSGYGERPLRASVVLFVLTFLFFPAMYMIFERDPFWVSVWDSFKVATFMRIGTPIEPDTGLGKFFLALESILCPTQFALFALALRRKVKR